MHPRALPTIAAVIALVCGLHATAATAVDQGDCLFNYSPMPQLPAFKDFPPQSLLGAPRRPDVATGQAHLYRTTIRQEAAGPVNFGGRYTIVGWGCGSSCLNWALVDRHDGHVYFDPAYQVVSTAYVDDHPWRGDPLLNTTFDGLRFRRDSTLLVVQGAPNEDESQEGVTFLRWTGSGFRKLAFVPASKLCRSDQGKGERR
jgi:hypothetical protein